jgi:hypothetical protein
MFFQRKTSDEYWISVPSNILAWESSQHEIVVAGITRMTIHLPNISFGIVCDCPGFALANQRKAAIKTAVPSLNLDRIFTALRFGGEWPLPPACARLGALTLMGAEPAAL